MKINAFYKPITLLTTVLCLAFLAGCGQKKAVSIDVGKLADELKNTVQFSDSMEEMSEAAFNNKYSIDASYIASKKIYVGSGATAEEIAVFEAKDDEAAGRIMTAVNSHIEEQIQEYTNYSPDELKKLRNPVKIQTGKYVILCISNHNDTAEACVQKYTK
jgi:hypothetical protein